MSKRHIGLRHRGGRTYIRYRVGRDQVEEPVPEGTSDKAAAELRSELLRRVSDGTWRPRLERVELPKGVPEEAAPFSELLAVYRGDWMKQKRNQAWQETMVKELERDFGTVPLPYLTPERVERWRDKMVRRGNSPTTVKKRLYFLRGVIRRSVETPAGRELVRANAPHLLRENPVDLVRKPPTTRGLKKTLSLTDAQRLLTAAHATDPALFRWAFLILRTGMRVEEAQGVTWRDVDLRAGAIRLRQTKTGAPRLVAVPEELVALLREWRLAAAGKGPVIGATFEGVPFKRWRKLFAAAKIPWGAGADGFTPRNLRTTFCMVAFREGARPEDLVSQTGHTLTTLLAYYAESKHEQRLAAAESVPRLFDPSHAVPLEGAE